MKQLIQKYRRLVRKREISIIFLSAVFLLTQKPSFSAILETNWEQVEKTVYVHVFMTVLPEEEVSAIQMEYAYDLQNCTFVSAFPGETLYISGKQMQVSPMYGLLRIIVIGFNNYPIASGELFTLQFNTLSEKINTSDFRILNAKLSSPHALAVNGTINNNEEEQTSTDNNSDIDIEKDIYPVNADNMPSSTETNLQAHIKLPDITNLTNIKPVSHETIETNTVPTHAQTSSAKSYNPILSSGFIPETSNPYIHQHKYQENKKTRSHINISNPISVPQKKPLPENQYIFNNKTLWTNETSHTSHKNTSPIPVFNKTQNQQAMNTKIWDNSTSRIIKNTNTDDNHNTPNIYHQDRNQSSHNTYLALNIPNLPATRGRSNECTPITEKDFQINNIPLKENTLLLLASIIITLMMPLTLLPMFLKKNLFSVKKDLEKEL